MTRTALVTGSAGFIGYHLARRLLAEGWAVAGLDAMTAYYDVALKERRLARLAADPGYAHVTARLEDPGALLSLMAAHRPELVIHLAAQAGVRYSLDEPRSYVAANLVGSFELLEAMRAHPPRHALIASTSSAYGATDEIPYRETQRTDHQVSFYAATKKATEAMAHSYAHLFGLPVTMFRFFTVYGPWGRPDMALFKFVRAIDEGRPIDIYNGGAMRRDFTYVDDLVEGIVRLAGRPPVAGAPVGPMDSLSPVAPYRVVNISHGTPAGLMDFVTAVETAMGRTAAKRFLPMQPGDMLETWADTALLQALIGDLAQTPLAEGVSRFVDWYRTGADGR